MNKKIRLCFVRPDTALHVHVSAPRQKKIERKEKCHMKNTQQGKSQAPA